MSSDFYIARLVLVEQQGLCKVFTAPRSNPAHPPGLKAGESNGFILHAFPVLIRGHVLKGPAKALWGVSPFFKTHFRYFPELRRRVQGATILPVASRNPLPAAPPLRGLWTVLVTAPVTSSLTLRNFLYTYPSAIKKPGDVSVYSCPHGLCPLE